MIALARRTTRSESGPRPKRRGPRSSRAGRRPLFTGSRARMKSGTNSGSKDQHGVTFGRAHACVVVGRRVIIAWVVVSARATCDRGRPWQCGSCVRSVGRFKQAHSTVPARLPPAERVDMFRACPGHTRRVSIRASINWRVRPLSLPGIGRQRSSQRAGNARERLAGKGGSVPGLWRRAVCPASEAAWSR